TPEDQDKHYLYRFWEKLPSPRTWAIFDRSWYGRVLVERVEGYCKPAEWKRAYVEINEFEQMLVADGVAIVKICLHISKKEQLQRFKERENKPYKRRKITKDDWRKRRKWPKYHEAIEDMFQKTSTRRVPWSPTAGERKWYARVTVCEVGAKSLEAQL